MKNKYISLHQSNFLPYIGYWAKIYHSEIHIIDYSVFFSTSSFQQRTFYYKQNGELDYLTMKVEKNKRIKDTKIIDFPNQKDKILNLFTFYKNNNINIEKTRFFYNQFKKILNKKEYKFLMDLNDEFFEFIYNFLQFKTKIYKFYDETYEQMQNKTEKLFKKIELFNNDNLTYLSGMGGLQYLDKDLLQSKYKCAILKSNDIFKGNILDYLIRYDNDCFISVLNNNFKMENYE